MARELPGYGMRFLLWMAYFLFVSIQSNGFGWSQSSNRDIRSVDFKNFVYPWQDPEEWPDHPQWMSLNLQEHIELVGGKWDDRSANDLAERGPFSGLTLEGVDYAKLSSGSQDSAIVVLRYDSGGTQYHYWVYIYECWNGKPELMGFFHAGERAGYGLYRVFAKNHELIVQLFDPAFREGDCCSSGYVSYRYRWDGRGFEAVGTPAKGRTASTSRRNVSIFGLPLD